jgi:hypothetical protein
MKAIALIALLFATLLAHADDPFVGAWRMNASASTYAANEMPKAMQIVMEQTPEGIHYRSETTHANDRMTVAEYTAEYDGKPVIVIGNAGLMAPVALKRIDANTIEATYIRGLQVVATSRRVLSNDRHTMTITTAIYDSQRNKKTNVGVYERVGPS